MAGGTRAGRPFKHVSGKPRVLVQGSVEPDTRVQLDRVADACGASQALVLELMIKQLGHVDPATGRPLWWDSALADYLDRQQQEELPLTG